MYKALYRKYRPKTFSDMVGQEHVRAVLLRQCGTGKTTHAYIFSGTRGTGKTTSAKILAKAVNCLSPRDGEPCGSCASCLAIENATATDVLELDAASNNSVDDVRALCDELIYPPAVLKKRVYIIDEVHMLSASAYNALLKTLEEPPPHVIFVLATTEPGKVPPTILSRCQRFEFRRLTPGETASRLLFVAEKEGLPLEKEAANIIARLSDGSVRDALSILESCAEAAFLSFESRVSASPEKQNETWVIDKSVVESQLGIAGNSYLTELFNKISQKDIAGCLILADKYYISGKSLSSLIDNMLGVIRDALFLKQGGEDAPLTLGMSGMSNLSVKEILSVAELFSSEKLIYFANTAEEAKTRVSNNAAGKKLSLELALIRMCEERLSISAEGLASRIALLEEKILGGNGKQKSEETHPIPVKSDVTEDKKIETQSEIKAPPAEKTLSKPIKGALIELLADIPAVKTLCQKSDIYFKDGRICIFAENNFAKSVLEGKLDDIKKAIGLLGYGECGVFFGEAKSNPNKEQGGESEKSYINEII
ncbi:MAG: DNA polymerase III subunit gamma/tau [Eubacteriales bacterium]